MLKWTQATDCPQHTQAYPHSQTALKTSSERINLTLLEGCGNSIKLGHIGSFESGLVLPTDIPIYFASERLSVKSKFTVKNAVCEESSATAYGDLTVKLTLTRTSGAALTHLGNSTEIAQQAREEGAGIGPRPEGPLQASLGEPYFQQR